MTSTEIANVTKLIKEIRSKLHEIERIMGKTSGGKFNYVSNHHQVQPPRKRNVYRNRDDNAGKS